MKISFMKKNFFLLCFLFFQQVVFAQSKQELVFSMNGALDHKSEVFTFQDRSGYLMQNQSDGLYRLHIEDIDAILSKANPQGAMVEVKCRTTGCFSITKGDSSIYNMGSYVYLFSSPERANKFAQALYILCGYFQGDPNPVNFQMIKGEKTLIDPPPATAAPAPVQKKDAIDEAMEEEDKEEAGTKKNPIKKETEAEDREEEDRTAPKGNVRKIRKEEEEDDETKSEPTPRSNRPRTTHDESGLANSSRDQEMKKESLLCKQLLQVVMSGVSGGFKSIEGPETNPKTHINESKLKLKGAKRNYLSWHKNQRAFIAEMKSTRSLEDIQFDYDDLQTEIENGLGSDWEDEDKSNDDEYANFSGEVRDTEYKSTKPGMPTIRLIMLSDGEEKYTLFIRVK